MNESEAPTAGVMTNDAFKQEQIELDEFVKSLPTSCWDEIGGEKRPNKSFFRLVGRRYNVDVVQVCEESELVQCNPDVCPRSCGGNHYEVRYTVRATRRDNGRHMDGDGSCIDNEKWLPRAKRCYGKQLGAVQKALRRYSEDDAARLVSMITEDRTTVARHLHPLEAKALLDFIYGDCPSLEPPIPLRNTRHNVRGTARTRAVNRAISDLVTGGMLSAEESTHTDREVDNAIKDADAAPPAETTKREPAAAPRPTAERPVREISIFQKKRIENNPLYKNLTDIQRGQLISDATGGEACRLEKLTSAQASKVITALDKLQPAEHQRAAGH